MESIKTIDRSNKQKREGKINSQLYHLENTQVWVSYGFHMTLKQPKSTLQLSFEPPSPISYRLEG
jgi:hypothetical protein